MVTSKIRTRTRFRHEEFLPRVLFDGITEVRVTRPQVVEEEAAARRRRPQLAPDGRLAILAADHPARMVLRAGTDPLAMGDRWALLARVLRVLAGEFDGVMATPDIMEELFILNRVDRELGGPGFLDHKVLIGCMNRGGLAGSAFELDDRMTAFTVERIAALRLDGAKMMFRLAPKEAASAATVESCAAAVTACQQRGIPAFLEAMMVTRTQDGYTMVRTPEAMIKVVNVAAGLGASSALTWLKIPYCPHFERVATATTCPILLLGGESRGEPSALLEEIAAALRAGPTVRGALVGRGVTFPGRDDPFAAAQAVSAVVHRGATADEAITQMDAARGRNFDRFARLVTA